MGDIYDEWTPERRRAQAERCRTVKSSDPLSVLAQRYWPVSDQGILGYCRQLDDAYNAGAGSPRG